MRSVLAHIAGRVDEFAELPLFERLRLGDVDAEPRVELMPYVAHFALALADLYRFVLPERRPRDRYQEWVRAQMLQDGPAWRWLVSDLARMQVDPLLYFTDALRFVWSDATVQSRLLTYRISRHGVACGGLRRLVLVHAVAAAAGVALEAAGYAGRRWGGHGLKRTLPVGGASPEKEGAGRAGEAGDGPGPLEEVVLEGSLRREAEAFVDEAFGYFSALADEAYAFGAWRGGRGALEAPKEDGDAERGGSCAASALV